MNDPSVSVAPSAPWMSFSDALVMWMLSTAMKAPSTPPNTVSQVLAGTLSPTGAEIAAGAATSAIQAFIRVRSFERMRG